MKKQTIRVMRGLMLSLFLCMTINRSVLRFNSSLVVSDDPLPSVETFWWDSAYQYRIQINLSNPNNDSIPVGLVVNVSLNSQELIYAGKMLVDGQDLRVVWYDSDELQWNELNRINQTNFNTISTFILFQTQSPIEKNDLNYYFYYGFNGTPSSLSAPPSDPTLIYSFFSNFQSQEEYSTEWSILSGSWGIFEHHLMKSDTNFNSKTLKLKFF